MRTDNDVPPPNTSEVPANKRRPSRRAILRLTAGTTVVGATGVLGIRPARASTCTDSCTNWSANCHEWCYYNDNTTACDEACDSITDECLNCCYAGGSPAQCTPPNPPVDSDLWSRANGLFVSAELEYTGSNYGMLRARASSIGPWEKFDILALSYPTVAILGSNGLYVSAELGYTGNLYGMLRARASSIGPWEKFTVGDSFAGGTGDVHYSLKAANNLYVSAELEYTGSNYAMLRARASKADGWEDYGWSPTPA